MPRFGLVGPTYQAQSVIADAQRCVNFLLEKDESGLGRSEMFTVDRPGMKWFSAIAAPPPGGPVGQLMPAPNGRLFAASNATNGIIGTAIVIAEIFANGGDTFAATVSGEGQVFTSPLSFAFSAQYCAFITPSGKLCYFDITIPFPSTPHFAQYSGGGGVITGLSQVVFLDGYFLCLKANSQQVIFSLDVTTFDPLDIFQVSITADTVSRIFVDHRELWISGAVDTVVYTNTGNPDNPFEPNPSGFIQEGIAAANSMVAMDNTLFWIGSSPRGGGIGWRANGYVPQRITNPAIEFAWLQYSTITDAVAFSMQISGHSLWVIYFPTANKTWVYDVSTGNWYEWSHINPNTGLEEAYRAWTHAYVFGKHLVGDWQTPAICEVNFPQADGSGGWNFVGDQLANGASADPIHRLRRCPHIASEGERVYIPELEVFMDVGVGPVPPLSDGAGGTRSPQIMLRCSRDGGQSWGNILPRDIGASGNFKQRVRWLKLGQARDWVLEFSISDPVPCRIVDGVIKPDYPSSRIATNLRKQA